jgi:hypothetical protein
MPRDREKNAYYTVGIPLDSETYRSLKTDSEETGVSIPQLLAVRIADWYKLSGGIGLAAGTQATRRSETPEQVLDAITPPASGLQSRASAAAAAWGGNEDD